jgi:hypothetical protein
MIFIIWISIFFLILCKSFSGFQFHYLIQIDGIMFSNGPYCFDF